VFCQGFDVCRADTLFGKVVFPGIHDLDDAGDLVGGFPPAGPTSRFLLTLGIHHSARQLRYRLCPR
jgi:hypothetical protein